MPIRRGMSRGPAVLALLLAVVVSLTGCELSVEEPPGAGANAQRVALSSTVVELPQYDVAISAIDFDPPLKRETVLDRQKPVKLLAAVENRGIMPVSRLSVEARITSQRGEFFAQERILLDKLSPGETKIVEFEGVAPENTLPRSPSYRIRVTVESPQGDSNLPNNSREVIIRVLE